MTALVQKVGPGMTPAERGELQRVAPWLGSTTKDMIFQKAIAPGDITDIYDSRDEQERLALVFEPRYRAILKSVHFAIAQAFGLDPDRFRLNDAATNRILVHAAERVVRIDETTRQAIAEQLRIGQELGLSTWQIANGDASIGYRGVEGLYRETWKGRAETIARTELQFAQNLAALDRYAATGMVEKVQIVDGDDDEPCRSRNGKVVSLSERPGLLHPNCTMNLLPVLRPGVA